MDIWNSKKENTDGFYVHIVYWYIG